MLSPAISYSLGEALAGWSTRACLKNALERTIGSGWQRGRQSEGRICVWVCVQGLKPHTLPSDRLRFLLANRKIYSGAHGCEKFDLIY